VKIVNFQKHEKLTIDFDHPVVCIVGESDCGKSSILRAIRWLVSNRPGGESFIRHGTSHSRVSVVIDDGETVTRRRDKGGKNLYKIGDREFTAFGVSVPDEIQSFLNIGEISLQRQHDPPFWFSLSPGEVSKELNQIVNLSLIDSTLANAASELRKAKAATEICEDRLKFVKQELEDYAFAKEMDTDLREIEELQEQIDGKASQIDQAERFLKKWTEALESKKIASERNLDAGNDIAEIESIREKLEEVSERLEQVEQLSTKWEQACRRKEESLKVLKEAESKFTAMKGKSCPLCGQKVTS